MASDSGLRALLVAEGSGGHLIPALELAHALADCGAQVKLWFAQRPQTAELVRALTAGATEQGVEVNPIFLGGSRTTLERFWRCGQLWSRSQRCFDTFAPDVVVGFGGWVSAPVVLAARARGRPTRWWGAPGRTHATRRIRCLLHEQNVALGRANRLLARWADCVAVSFRETLDELNGTPSVLTGMPVRRAIGQRRHASQALPFGFREGLPTLLVLGGSQGSRALNRVVTAMTSLMSPSERAQWQLLHVAGATGASRVQQAYARCQMTAWVTPFLPEMERAYAMADLAIARAGASTIAELARAGLPSVLIPYPYAGGHQRANARMVEVLGGAVVIEESAATPERLLSTVRRLLADARLRAMMSEQVRRVGVPDASQRLLQAVLDLCHPAPRGTGTS